ncbi:MAG: tetratricopeptide repeat protein [Lachnospiraceae bacterium]|nr:tetratricopeptide repeat protein [Lachnospiraceae bacterium]
MSDEWSVEKIIRLSNTYYNKGLEKAQVRDMSGAILCLRQSVRLYKMNIDARNLLGLIYYETGEIVDALAEWLISSNYRRKGNVANRYIGGLQDHKEALDEMAMAVHKYNQALTLLRDDSEDLAILQVNKVLNLNPRFVKAYQLAALIYIRRRSYGRADRLLRKAHSIDRTNAATLRYIDELKAIAAKRRKSRNGDGEEEPEWEDGGHLSADDVIIPTYKETSGGWKTVLSLLAGIGFGLAGFYYLVMPQEIRRLNDGFNQTTVSLNEQMNDKDGEIKNLNNRIVDLEGQITDLQGNLDHTNTTNQNVLQTYAKLLLALRNFRNNDYLGGVNALSEVSEEGIADETFLTIYRELQAEVSQNGPNTLYTAGYDAYQARNYEQSKMLLAKCLELQPDSVDAMYWLGLSYVNTGDSATGNQYFTQIVEKYPNHQLAAQARTHLASAGAPPG